MVKKPNKRSPLVAPNRNAQKQKKKSGSINNKNIKNKHNSITNRIKNFVNDIINAIFQQIPYSNSRRSAASIASGTGV